MITLVQKELYSHLVALYPEQTTTLAWHDIEVTCNDVAKQALGECATNCCLTLAKKFGTNPRALGDAIRKRIAEQTDERSFLSDSAHNGGENSSTQQQPVIVSAEVAGPGFLNIRISNNALESLVQAISHSVESFTHQNLPPFARTSYVVEFVSANPTGPLHLGHGRNGIVGDVLARVLRELGHTVTREFYINDAGSQMEKLGESVKIRAEQLCGGDAEIPEGHYRGDYIIDLARTYLAAHGPEHVTDAPALYTADAYKQILSEQKKDLADYGITFDRWFSEKSLHDSGAVQRALDELYAKGLLYQHEGALWFKATLFGDDKDRVIQKGDGALTYIAADIAYHADKFSRADKLITVLGQDHHGYVQRLKGTLAGLGYNRDNLIAVLTQLVSIKNGSIPIKMSKRAGTFTTLRELIDAIGVDAARFFFLHKKIDSHLEIDVATALEHSSDNPLFYLQYAYVRTRAVERKAREAGLLESDTASLAITPYTESEKEVLKQLALYPHTLMTIMNGSAPHLLATYAYDLATTFHSFYAANKIISDDTSTTLRRLKITKATEAVLRKTFSLLGISTPEEM